MRTVHYCTSFSLTSETFVYSYIKNINKKGVEGHVLTHHRKNENDRPFPHVTVVDKFERWHPKRLFHRGLEALGFREENTSHWPVIRDRLEAAVRRIQPDVIHAHFGPAGVWIAPVAERLGIPLVVTFYGYDLSTLLEQPFWHRQYDTLWNRVSMVTVLSEDMKETVRRLGCPEDNVQIVHLSRDLDQFPYREPQAPVRRYLFVGRLVEKKAPMDAVRAFQQAQSEYSDLRLDIVGDGPLMQDLTQFVTAHDLTDHVTLHGRVPNEKVSELMRAADAFLLPSKTAPDGDREGTPTVLVEAQASGLPCVSTTHAGIPEMIPDANHNLLTPEGNVDQLASRMSSLSSLDTTELSTIARRGRDKVAKEFNIEKETDLICDIYSRLNQ